MYCVEKPDDWSLYLADAQFAHNSHIHSTHGQIPFYLLHSYEPTAYPSDVANPPGLADDRLEQLAANRDKAVIAHKRAQEAMIERRPGLAYKKFEVGDRVWLDARNLHLKTTRKLTKATIVGNSRIAQAYLYCVFNDCCLKRGSE